jgi:DNA polymerase III sliding clamp (beta) subunit (PCNA family)
LAEFLSVVREGEVVVRFPESNMQASVWQPLQDDRCRYIVMPMMLPGSEE